MQYHFNSNIAEEVGVEGATMLDNIHYWVMKNKANDKNFYDGNYWTFNSINAFTELFPFWSKRQIERILKNLKDEGYIQTGNYNKSAYDRTLWYALTEKGWNLFDESISPNEEMKTTKRGNENNQTVEPIPNKKQDKKQQDKKQIYGEYENVKLTDKEKEKLLNELDEFRFNLVIKRLDEYIEETGKKYKNHYLTIKRWVIEAVEKDLVKNNNSNSISRNQGNIQENLIKDEKDDPEFQKMVEELDRRAAELEKNNLWK